MKFKTSDIIGSAKNVSLNLLISDTRPTDQMS